MTAEEKEEEFKWANRWNQYFTAAIVNLHLFAHGNTTAWAATAMPILSSKDTPLESGPLPTEKISWIGSINAIGVIIGTIVLCYIVSLIGSKRAIVLLAPLEIIYWILIYFGNHYYYILIARVLSGLMAATSVPIVLFLSEISNDDIRGRIGTSTVLFRNIGVMASYLLGTNADFYTVPLICIPFPLIFLIIFPMLPNTPQFYLKNDQPHKAEKALKFYKGYRKTGKMEDIAFSKELNRLKIVSTQRKMQDNIRASDFWSKDALKGFAACFWLSIFALFTGLYVISGYAVNIFNKTGTTIDSFVSLLMMSAALIIGSLLSTFFADILGRKILNVISLGGSALGLFVVSIYHYFFINGYDLSAFVWIPVASLLFVIFISSAGVISITAVTIIELLPSKIRTSSYVIVITWMSLCNFVINKCFPILLEIINLHGCCIILGIGSTLGVIFVILVMEETTGKSLDDVQLEKD